jgi:hypothetical protein
MQPLSSNATKLSIVYDISECSIISLSARSRIAAIAASVGNPYRFAAIARAA